MSKWFIFSWLCAALCVGGCQSLPTSQEIERKHYAPFERDLGISAVSRVGNQLYLSGIVGSGEDMSAQLKSCYQSISNILADYGTDTRAIVRETIYTRDIDKLKTLQDERKAFFTQGNYPSATWVQVERLYLQEFLIEVEVQVLLPVQGDN
ncbi:RidA family protein [Bowmanella yangjiangensis]|uniref:RidA family protein n=1 Tax=Bowmanella yangjiangensis TaxID=2811230 RepID=A0ABS3CUI6_9ALTE|nr:RidA family protein [Bowmanella yangjiangensis]MBN7820791.1 RidA family protein [Bowmanella yangjiangensis]